MANYLTLPQELFVEILVRLPIEDLIKSTAVCKSWNSLIKNPNFISAHLEKTISSTNTHLLLFRLCTLAEPRSFFSESVVEHYSLRLDNEDVDEYKQLQFPDNKLFSFTGCFRVAGSINGLVCLVDDMRSYIYNFILWNPIIKKAVRVPEPGVKFSSHGPYDAFTGFGFDSKTNDYKLLRYVKLNDGTYSRKESKVEVEIFSLNANCWRSITHIAPKYGVIFKYPRTYGNSFVNGAIHMLACDREGDRDRNLILAFDVFEEAFREIPLPDSLSNDPMKLMWTELLRYGQSIAAMTWEWNSWNGNEGVKQIHLWVMKEYGVAMSWTKVLTEVAKRVPRVLFFRKDEEVFVTREDGWIASLDIKSQHSEVFGVQSVESLTVESLTGYPVVDSFVESLVLLDKSNACALLGYDYGSLGEIDEVAKELEHALWRSTMDRELNEFNKHLEQKETEMKLVGGADTEALKQHYKKKIMELEEEKRMVQRDDLLAAVGNRSANSDGQMQKTQEINVQKLKALEAQLKKEGRRDEYERHKLEALNQRQILVLQRKTEEAATAAKRLKELLEARKSSARDSSVNHNGHTPNGQVNDCY
ncbi:hypothetical protein COLO4_35211 [Corchorus olitorius]|uniref:F-box domain-containing protein n=1 Tax=Corchorus olitorius TaxID=93759 RepID=A0A1R3GHU6_9ROSI|nr:hypothetical protein COLO4_35211 [Corchorus olitorius]